MADQYKMKIIWVCDIAGPGKTEADHVGELSKVVVRRKRKLRKSLDVAGEVNMVFLVRYGYGNTSIEENREH